MTEALPQRVLNFMLDRQLVSRGETLLVAVSGGPDSVCLLHVLARLREVMDIKLAVGHLNHELRGEDAKADAEYVRELSRQMGVPATLDRRSVESYRAEHRVSLEEAAREVRYTFLSEVAQHIGASRVAVGHTSDDNIETILLHLVRGSGSRGLRGLQPLSQWRIGSHGITAVRPLLPVTREETEAYCRENNLAPRFDVSNLSLSPLRNRIRHKLLPLLKSYNPRVAEALLRTAAIVSDDLACIEEEGGRAWNDVAEEQERTIILRKKPFLGLEPAIRRHVLRTAVEKLLGNLRDIEMRHVEELMTALAKPAGKIITLPGNLLFVVEYDRYLLGTDPDKLCPFPALEGEFALNVPGETSLPGWRVEAAVLDRKQTPADEDNLTARLDYGVTGNRLTVRARRAGDRFQPLGLSQSKSLGEFMIDARIPHSWRDRIPVVSSPTGIIWLVGFRIDDRAKVTDSTRQVLLLELVPRMTMGAA